MAINYIFTIFVETILTHGRIVSGYFLPFFFEAHN